MQTRTHTNTNYTVYVGLSFTISVLFAYYIRYYFNDYYQYTYIVHRTHGHSIGSFVSNIDINGIIHL